MENISKNIVHTAFCGSAYIVCNGNNIPWWGMSVTSQFSGIFVIQFSLIKAQKKQPKLRFYFIIFPSGFDVFAVFMGGEDEDSEVWMRSSV